ncbi:MAG: hypothetical protein ABL919_16025 [Methylococcales bacterium]
MDVSSDEIFAKLVTIEQLLIVLLSDKKYEDRIRSTFTEIHNQFGAQLNTMFPSDEGYNALKLVVENHSDAVLQITASTDWSA